MTNLNLGLSVQDVVNVSVFLAPNAAQQRSFGALMILGDSYVNNTPIIDLVTRYRLYTSLTAVANDFTTSTPEYQAAAIYFGQSPSPAQVYIGSWAVSATAGTLIGGVLSSVQQQIGSFTSITNAGASFTVDGVVHNLSGLNFSACTTLGGTTSTAVSYVIQTAFAGSALVTWNANNNYFQITSATSGTSSTVSFGTPYGGGSNLNALINTSAGQGGYVSNGASAESAVSAVATLAAMSNSWYGLMFGVNATPGISTLSQTVNGVPWANLIAVAAYIQAASPVRILGCTTQEAAALVNGDSTSLAYQMSNLNYTRTFVQYSSSSAYACAAMFGIAFTCQFNGVNTLYTLKFKQELGIAVETLTETQAAQLNTTNCNVFVNYNNATAILQQGTMASGQFFDVIHGTDWLQNAVQTAVYNVLYTSTTKIPQTDQGVGLLVGAVTNTLNQAVANDLIAPGIWYGPAIGGIITGQNLVKGYYVYAPPVATQTQAARAARQAPVITAAIKLAGAIHSATVVIDVSN